MRPVSIRMFAWLFGLSCLLSLGLTWLASGMIDFGFALRAEAAHTLAIRILWIRLAGVAFAVWLMALVVAGRSRAARGALLLRWLLGLSTSIAFLRAIGILLPSAMIGPAAVAISVAQLAIEGFAIVILFGDDAAEWFEPRSAYR